MNSDVDAYIKIISMAKCLRGFGVVDVKQLLSISSKMRWKAGDDVFYKGDSGRNMYIICSGIINIWRKSGERDFVLATLSAGECFGEIALVAAGKRSAGAKALEDTLALCISSDRLHEVPAASSILYKNIAKALAEKLTIANDVIIFHSKITGGGRRMSGGDRRIAPNPSLLKAIDNDRRTNKPACIVESANQPEA